MGKERVKAWVTKNALTQGIQVVDGDIMHDISSRMLVYGEFGHAYGKDWYLSLEEALERVEEMRRIKIKFLKKQLVTTRAIKIRVCDGSEFDGK